MPPAPPKRLAYKRNTEWSTDDDSEPQNEPNDLRDSGISTASLLDFQSHLTNLNNLGYEDFEPRTRCNDIMNISPPSIINPLNVSTGNFASGIFQSSHSLPGQEVILTLRSKRVHLLTPRARIYFQFSLTQVSPPPIPPKAHQDIPSAPSTLERASSRAQHGHSENYSVPKLQTLSVASDTESTV